VPVEISVIKVAAVQMDCILGNKEENLAKSISLLEEACDQGAKLILLPELFSTGYWVEEWDMELAENIPGETTHRLKRFANERGVYISGSILEHGEARGVIYDTAFLISPGGLEGIYRKIFLWDSERTRFKNAHSFPIFKSSLGNIGMQICYEVGFPEGARLLAMKGADILLYPSAFGLQRLYVWDIATRSRAVENGVFLLAANRSGRENEGQIEFAGHSRIVNPRGEVLAEAENMDQVIVTNIDLALVPEQRRAVPYLRDFEDLSLLNAPKKSDLA